MAEFKIIFADPQNPVTTAVFRGAAPDIEQAIKLARDALFFDAPLRSATWVIKTVEQSMPPLVEDHDGSYRQLRDKTQKLAMAARVQFEVFGAHQGLIDALMDFETSCPDLV